MSDRPLNCWQQQQCGREPGGERVGELGPCPAATAAACDGINHGCGAGRFCWAVTGTLCHEEVQGTLAQKIDTCQRCPFFRRVKYEEGCHFQLLKPGLETTDSAELHRLLNGMVKLMGMCRDIFACLAVRPLLTSTVEYACATTGASSAAAYLVAASGEELVLDACAGQIERPQRVDLRADTPAAEAARTRRLCKGAAAVGGGKTAPAAAIPISGDSRVAGVLELIKPDGEFSSDDEWFLREFGLIAGLGIENATHVDDLRQLRAFDKAKSRFVAVLMHHIASPLATIACSLQAISQLGDKLKVEDRQELIAHSLERIGAVQGLSRRLLDLAAIRRGTSLSNVRPVRLAEPLRQEIEARQAAARDKGVEIVVADDAGESLVLADPDGLRVVFGNLLGNAIKYSRGPDSRVDVELGLDDDTVRVRIRDRGIGIPATEQASIFEEFQRGSNVGAAHATGFGLGLAIVRELVDRYQGRIDLESEVGVGTTVCVELPVAAEAAGQGAD